MNSDFTPYEHRCDDDAYFDQLQMAWDAHRRRVDDIVESHPLATSLNYGRAISGHRRLLARYIVLTIMFLGCAVYWGVLFPSLVFNSLSVFASLVAEAIFVFFFVTSLRRAIAFVADDPVRVARRSQRLRLAVLSRAESKPVASEHEEGGSLVPAYVHRRGVVRKYATVGIAAMFALIVVSCTTTGMDGYYMAESHQSLQSRTAAVEHINLIAKMP